MKVLLSGIIFVIGSTTIVFGQQGRGETPVEAGTRAKLIAELAAVTVGQSVKNSPFSAEEVSESVQTLADGNRIVRSSTGRIYRNGEGRIRREHSGGTGSIMSSFYSTGSGISLISPAEGHKYLLDTHEKTAKVLELTQTHRELVIAGAAKAPRSEDEANAMTEFRKKIEVEARAPEPLVVVQAGPDSGMTIQSTAPGRAWAGSRYETRTEQLGTRDFEGVSAEGTRRITTIPPGAIGNERPIETVYERWYSNDLRMVVYSKNTDPRFGEQTYQLINIIRAEPDPSLFSVPTEYRKIVEPATVYRISSGQTKSVKAAASAKTADVPRRPASSKP